MSNQLYGPEFILKERSSGYRSSSYALAEIIDNSVDAQAKNIDIYLVDSIVGQRASQRTRVNEIYVCDDGAGMSISRLNGCLTFSEGEGVSDRRIGAFGVGLPKSSISMARRVEVFSREKGTDNWNYVYLDIDELLAQNESNYNGAIQKKPDFLNPNEYNKYNTIIRWLNLDKIDFKQGKTIAGHMSKLFGRIYRYQLIKGLKITTINSIEQGNGIYHKDRSEVLIYDPMFLHSGRSQASIRLWDFIENPKGVLSHKTLGDRDEYKVLNYYEKYLYSDAQKGIKPLFQENHNFHDVTYDIDLNNRKYKWTLKASFAPSDFTNPGIRSGGQTEIGKMFGEKMDGTPNFKSGNIFFIRAGREIDFGHFGLYKVNELKHRFWTIEVHFDSDLDELLGLSNNKQSVMFNQTTDRSLGKIIPDVEMELGEMRMRLWSQMTIKITAAIEEMRQTHRDYAKNWLNQEKIDKAEEGGGKGTGPIETIEPAVFEVLPQGDPWTEEDKSEITEFLKSRFLNLPLSAIREQVEVFAEGKTRTLVLYAPIETGVLFELTEKRGKEVTLINNNHKFYTQILEPLKSHRQLSIFAIAIEMLISSQSVEMDRLIYENKSKYYSPLNKFKSYFSDRLDEFIEDSRLRINVDFFLKELVDDNNDIDEDE